VVGKNKITYANWGVFRAKPLMIGEGASELVLVDRDRLIEKGKRANVAGLVSGEKLFG
jgi:hypothetical protein